MAVSQDQLDFVNDQLSSWGPYETKKMFGGVGFFREGIMFALIGKDVFHFRVDEENVGDYESQGMKGFMSSSKKKGMPYYEVPPSVLEDRDELAVWAQKAYDAAVRNKK